MLQYVERGVFFARDDLVVKDEDDRVIDWSAFGLTCQSDPGTEITRAPPIDPGNVNANRVENMEGYGNFLGVEWLENYLRANRVQSQ